MDRFIFSHKDITCPDGYEVVDNRKSDLDHRMYSEIAGLDFLTKKYKEEENKKVADSTGKTNTKFPPDWVQTNHYRRRMDIDACNRTYVAQPLILSTSVAQHYAACHFIQDLELMGKAIKELYPQMIQPAEQVLNGNILIPYNIVNCQYNQFLDWATFIITVLKKVAEYMGNPTFEQMKEIISTREQPKVEGRNNDVAYQSRIYGFLSERASSIYWLTAAKKMPIFPATIIKSEGAW